MLIRLSKFTINGRKGTLSFIMNKKLDDFQILTGMIVNDDGYGNTSNFAAKQMLRQTGGRQENLTD